MHHLKNTSLKSLVVGTEAFPSFTALSHYTGLQCTLSRSTLPSIPISKKLTTKPQKCKQTANILHAKLQLKLTTCCIISYDPINLVKINKKNRKTRNKKISRDGLHLAFLSNYLSKNCTKNMHYIITSESSCKIKLYSNMFQWQPIPSCGEVHFIS